MNMNKARLIQLSGAAIDNAPKPEGNQLLTCDLQVGEPLEVCQRGGESHQGAGPVFRLAGRRVAVSGQVCLQDTSDC